jgi:hypothetical protein
VSLFVAATGTVECATGVLCVVGAGQIAVGTAGTATGYAIAQSGSDNLGKAFREADSNTSGSRSGNSPQPTVDELLKSGIAADKNNYSRAGHELKKHAHRSTNAGQWPHPSGKQNPWSWNEVGQSTLVKILGDPKVAIQWYTNRAGDGIIEYHVSWGGSSVQAA